MQTIERNLTYSAKEVIRSFYKTILNREPEESGLINSIHALEVGVPIEEILTNMLNSSEYKDSFPESNKIWENLEKLNADICITLNICDKQFNITAPAVDQSVFRDILQSGGSYENHISDFLSKNLKTDQIFIDIGANIGVFSVLASKLVGENGKVISFEPSPINYHYLNQNIIKNQLLNINIFNLGLWNEEAELKFESAKWSLGSSHILLNEKHSDFPETETIIKCVSLDTMNLSIDKIDLIKMDIEGAELFALRGMRITIEKYKPVIVMEINRYCMRNFFKIDANDIYNFFNEIGYYVEGFSTLDIPEDGIVDIIARPN